MTGPLMRFTRTVTSSRRLTAAAVGLPLICASLYIAHAQSPASILSTETAAQAAAPVSTGPLEQLEALARADPIAFLTYALDHYNRHIRDYQCVLFKQERINGKLLHAQRLEIQFLDEPFALLFNYLENGGLAQKILYNSVGTDGKPTTTFRILPAGVLRHAGWQSRDIHGPEALANSRKTLDQFGFENALLMLRDVATRATETGRLRKLAYLGQREVDGRTTLLFERVVHAEGADFPDSICLYHIDLATLLPTGVTSLDKDGELLGHYLFTQLRVNNGLKPDFFTVASQGN